MKSIRYKWILVLLISFLLTSCAASSRNEAFYGGEAESEAPREAMSDSVLMKSAQEPAPSGDVSTVTPNSVPAVEESRKRIYNGSAGIIVEDTEETRTNLETLTIDAGGYVESSYSDYMELRIPAEIFSDFFNMVLSLGKIEYSRVETRDVTDAFADIQRRLSTAEETRSRLYILLEKSTDPKERAQILREIGRLTEEIESLKQQTAIMESRIAFSRITVQLIPRIQGDYSRGDIPFPWIAYLDPLYPAGDKIKARVSLDPGMNFAVFSKDSVYMAEDSNGIQILISSVPNSPLGDAQFWQRALVFHLGPFYAELNEKNLSFGDNELLGVELISKDREPFKYFVGVVIDGKNLHIVEIFSPESKGKFGALYKAFAQGELK
ncbi:MAG: DUF4349 domain-containing protein [Spirochaetaceae bacterium]|nr:DUF4349 domain-containing protein [Spirochaetaceae bacterium]